MARSGSYSATPPLSIDNPVIFGQGRSSFAKPAGESARKARRKVGYLVDTNANDPGPPPIEDLRTRKGGF